MVPYVIPAPAHNPVRVVAVRVPVLARVSAESSTVRVSVPPFPLTVVVPACVPWMVKVSPPEPRLTVRASRLS